MKMTHDEFVKKVEKMLDRKLFEYEKRLLYYYYTHQDDYANA